jgi:hypothetical protein
MDINYKNLKKIKQSLIINKHIMKNITLRINLSLVK